ncbi:MAG: ferritin-like domain-containing protein [Pseudomonadales bacterium]|nr:ferritin-like domain-containing protein [Pseudomonadales bacterium]
MGDEDEVPREYASPVCYAHEFESPDDVPRTVASSETVEVLQALLEGERAGARIARETRDELDRRGGTLPAVRSLLDSLAQDEARYCRVLIDALRRMGVTPGTAIGEFHAKCMAINDLNERLAFLNRGQRWVSRKIEEILPGLEAGELASVLVEMRETHEANIDRVNAILPAVS